MALDLVKCGMCGEAVVIARGQRSVCESCRESEHELYSTVRTLIRENLDVRFTMRDAAEILKVEESKIKHLVDSGFIKLTIRGIQIS